MSFNIQSLSILNKFNFERSPVGVKFLFNKPEGMEKLTKTMDLCEMLVEAQSSEPFYITRDNLTCVGPMLLGMTDDDPIFESGQLGPQLEIYNEARANRRVYQYIPRLKKGTINYLAFARLNKLNFDPDILIITATVDQAEILLRAYSYTTGKIWSAKGTSVIGCSWLFLYPCEEVC